MPSLPCRQMWSRPTDPPSPWPRTKARPTAATGQPPYPLSYFVTALASCFMVQARRFASVLNIDAGKIDLDLHGEWSAEVAEDGTYTGHPKAFRLDISFSGDASLADKTRLVQAAAAGCFVEAVMKDGILFHRIRHEDTWHDV